jgi:hypothetical protein
MPDNAIFRDRLDTNPRRSPVTIQKWGGLASFLLAVAFIVPEFIYLVGNLQAANGPLTYDLADLLYGPLRAASLVTAVYALREQIGERAPRWLSLLLLAVGIAAAMFVMAALFRSSNRAYHLHHPELNLQMSSIVLTVWATLVTGVIATAWHFLGWSLLLLGTAGWTSGRLPRALSVSYWVVGSAALFVYLQPELEGGIVLFGAVIAVWQGIFLWKAEPGKTATPKINASQPDLA